VFSKPPHSFSVNNSQKSEVPMYAVSQAQILRDIDEEIRIAEISNHIVVIIEATVITAKCIVLGSSFWNNSYLERACNVGKATIRNTLETLSEESYGPVDQTVVDSGLALWFSNHWSTSGSIREFTL
jgi:hypothetical protein